MKRRTLIVGGRPEISGVASGWIELKHYGGRFLRLDVGKGERKKDDEDVKVSIIILFLQSCSFSYTSIKLNLSYFPVVRCL
jgi:hypothetical protein